MACQSIPLIFGAAKLRDRTESVLWAYIRSAVTISLQKMRDLLTKKPCLEFSIAFETASNNGDEYLDLSANSCWRCSTQL